jgi:hypothetical protein
MSNPSEGELKSIVIHLIGIAKDEALTALLILTCKYELG